MGARARRSVRVNPIPNLDPVRVYYCITYYKALRVGGGG
jgi:hypothetical protein